MAQSVARALAFHQCGPSLNPGSSVICGLSLLLVLVLAPRVFLQVLRFSSLLKKTTLSGIRRITKPVHVSPRKQIKRQRITVWLSYLVWLAWCKGALHTNHRPGFSTFCKVTWNLSSVINSLNFAHTQKNKNWLSLLIHIMFRWKIVKIKHYSCFIIILF